MDIGICFIKLLLIYSLTIWIESKEKFISRSSLTVNYLTCFLLSRTRPWHKVIQSESKSGSHHYYVTITEFCYFWNINNTYQRVCYEILGDNIYHLLFHKKHSKCRGLFIFTHKCIAHLGISADLGQSRMLSVRLPMVVAWLASCQLWRWGWLCHAFPSTFSHGMADVQDRGK